MLLYPFFIIIIFFVPLYLIVIDTIHLYTQQDFLSEVKKYTNNVGVDVVYDSVGKDTWEGNDLFMYL